MLQFLDDYLSSSGSFNDSSASHYDHTIKLALVGDPAVGKSSIVKSFVEERQTRLDVRRLSSEEHLWNLRRSQSLTSHRDNDSSQFPCGGSLSPRVNISYGRRHTQPSDILSSASLDASFVEADFSTHRRLHQSLLSDSASVPKKKGVRFAGQKEKCQSDGEIEQWTFQNQQLARTRTIASPIKRAMSIASSTGINSPSQLAEGKNYNGNDDFDKKIEPGAQEGIDYQLRFITLCNGPDKQIRIKVQIWDTLGVFNSLVTLKACVRSVHGVIIVYDVTNPASLESTKLWIERVRNLIGTRKNVTICILGNKIDLLSSIRDSASPVFANSIGVNHYYVSAQTGRNVFRVFARLCNRIMQAKQSAHRCRALPHRSSTS